MHSNTLVKRVICSIKEYKKFFIVLSVLFFFGSNVIYFSGDVCASSPCEDSSINQSERVSDQGTFDYFGGMSSNFILSPTTILIKPILRSQGYEITGAAWWNGDGDFDMSDEVFEATSERSMWSSQSDISDLRNAYLISKAVTVLSLPFWLLYGFTLILLYKKSKPLGIALGIILFVMAISPILFTYAFGQLVTVGSYRYTNQILF